MFSSSSARKRRLLTGAALLFGASLLLTGCRAGGAGSSAADKKTGEGLVIGWSQRGISGSDWWKTLVQGGQAEAKKLGAKIDLLDANGDTVQQNSDVQTLVSKNVDVVIMNPNDPIGVAPSVNSLKSSGIPLVTVNSSLDKSLVPDEFCYVAEDQGATGALAGAQAAKQVIARDGSTGPVKVLGIGGFPGDVLTDLRFNGFKSGFTKVMSAYPGIKVDYLPTKYGSWKPDDALAPIRDVATANPDIKVVYNMSDVMMGGVVQGLQQAGVYSDKLVIATYDGGMTSIKTMKDDPTGPLVGDASNQPYDQGAEAVKMAVAAYAHQQSACPTKVHYIQTTLVTPQDAAQYYNASETYVRAKEND